MTLKTHDAIPTTWNAGDLLTWLFENSDYIPGTHVLTWEFAAEGATAAPLSINGTDNGDGRYNFELSTLTAGRWHWRVFVLDGSDKLTLERGVIAVKTVPVTGIDPRSHYKIVLDNITAVLENRATKDQLSYSFQGRSLQKTPLSELREFQRTYESLVAEERAAENPGSATSSTIKAQF